MQINWSVYQKDPEALRQLWEAAHLDALTKLYNRYGMETWITQQLEKMADCDHAAMLMIDVDNFKYINDTYGHMLGDALLIDIADTIRNLFPEDFFCGRIGGDEYQIFALNISRDTICEKAHMLCSQIKEKYEKEHQNYHISISIGIAFSEQDRGRDYADLYKMADLALYQAKMEGKNGYMLYGEAASKKIAAPRRSNEKAQNVQLGDSGFSVNKVLLDAVIDELALKEDSQTTIEKISKLIVDAFDVTRAYASCYTKDEMHIGKSFFYAQNDDPNITPNLKISGRDYEKKCFNSDGIFFCTDIEKSVEPVKSELKRMQVQTLLQVLLHKDGKIIGTLGINNCGYKRLWLQSEIEVIHTIGKLMTDTIYELQQSMED
ncbi:MAG: diguanylate cyclase [Roseburia inulinivorans]|nr:diguanylate cyclase [bacterium]MDY3040052.1 diguanylate cyclase [Roseburia inulinivorans]